MAPTTREERETLVVFSDKDRLEGGMAKLYTFNARLKDKALAAGGKVTREHARDGKVEAWDVDIAAKQVKIGFRSATKSAARVEAGKRLLARRTHGN